MQNKEIWKYGKQVRENDPDFIGAERNPNVEIRINVQFKNEENH